MMLVDHIERSNNGWDEADVELTQLLTYNFTHNHEPPLLQ